MTNFVMIAIGLSLVSGIPNPDLLSVDIAGFQGGCGVYGGSLMIPSVEANAGRFKLYWGERITFSAGVEVIRGYFTQSLGMEYPPYWPILSSLEIATPQIGAACLGKPRPTLLSKCLSPQGQFPGTFVPRLELSSGIVPVALNWGGEWVLFSSIRSELNWYLIRGVSVQLQHRFFPSGYHGSELYWWKNLLNLSLCFSLGMDYLQRE